MIYLRSKPRPAPGKPIDGHVHKPATNHAALYERALQLGIPVSPSYTKAQIEALIHTTPKHIRGSNAQNSR